MIPKRAFFCWGGGEMPWIRRLSVESFSILHPTWSVEVLRVDGADRQSVVNASDLLRYEQLVESGGCYFDTDIIFMRPIDSLLDSDADTFVCYDESGTKYFLTTKGTARKVTGLPEWFSIASLFSTPGNEFFSEILRSAKEPGRFNTSDQQFYGVTAFSARFKTLQSAKDAFPKLRFFNIPRKAFLPVSFLDTRTLYRTDSGLYESLKNDSEVYGLHWFGGDTAGRIADGWTGHDYWKDCPLGKAISRVELERTRRVDSRAYQGQ